MAPSDEDDFPSIGNKCFEICKLLGNQGLAFKFKLTFGTFCFSLDTMEIRTSPAPGPVKKKKSQSAINRDKRRRIEFLQRKAAASSQGASLSVLDISSSGLGNPSPVDIQGAAAAQRDTHDINQTSNTSDSGDTKLPRLRSREEGKRLSYLTRRISTLKQQTEFNQRCIGMLTCFQPFNSIGLAKFGIEEDSLVRDKDGDRFRLPPEKCGFGFQDPEEPEDRKEALQCVMCNKPMTLDHQC